VGNSLNFFLYFTISVFRICIGFSADPDSDPAFYLDADPVPDPDPGSQTNADPDPDQTYKSKNMNFNIKNILKVGIWLKTIPYLGRYIKPF
jgi:hypothetical protein